MKILFSKEHQIEMQSIKWYYFMSTMCCNCNTFLTIKCWEYKLDVTFNKPAPHLNKLITFIMILLKLPYGTSEILTKMCVESSMCKESGICLPSNKNVPPSSVANFIKHDILSNYVINYLKVVTYYTRVNCFNQF